MSTVEGRERESDQRALTRLSMLAIARLNDAAAAKDLIEAAAAPAVKSGEV
jgi:hypothetical protein